MKQDTLGKFWLSHLPTPTTSTTAQRLAFGRRIFKSLSALLLYEISEPSYSYPYPRIRVSVHGLVLCRSDLKSGVRQVPYQNTNTVSPRVPRSSEVICIWKAGMCRTVLQNPSYSHSVEYF